MNHLKMAAPAVLLLALFAGTADAQKKKSRKASARRPAVTKSTIPPLEVRAARTKVDAQLANVTNFVDKFGPIAEALELLDGSYAAKRVSESKTRKHESNKRGVIQTIRNLRDGLAALESEFRTKTTLLKYLANIQGITDLANDAEDAALAGKFVDSKEPLREASRKLTDTLAIMPKSAGI